MPKKLSEQDAERARQLMSQKYDDKLLLKTYQQRAVSICGSGDWYRVARFASWVADHSNMSFFKDEESAAVCFCYFRLDEMIKASYEPGHPRWDNPKDFMCMQGVRDCAYAELEKRGALGLLTGENDGQ